MKRSVILNRTLRSQHDERVEAAFTRIDLVAVVLVLVLCCAVLLPALARTQPDSRVFQCLNNHRQLTRAWLMYAADNDERLAISLHGAPTMALLQPMWAPGWLDWGTSGHNTNTIILSHPQYSILADYFGKDARLFKCPADRYLGPVQRVRGWNERVRSVSMNIYLGGRNVDPFWGDASFQTIFKLTELVNPNPSATWLSLDEHPDSINDAAFFVPMFNELIDWPANYHDGGAGFAFADGRAEVRRWRSSTLKRGVIYQDVTRISMPANDPDVQWLRDRTPRRFGGN